ncbi:MAG TPA: YtxH domain-containing protein [Bryobacteraceae bacterium]|jgi:gas vesicle protein|nr:YtxH domain-containing protein [Bryobacteraceae bacterium]
MSEEYRKEIRSTDDEGANRLGWFLTGAVIGVTIAMLYSPRSGKDTRQYLSDQGREKFGDGAQGIIEASKEMFERGRQLVEDAAELFERGRRLVNG